MTKTEAVQVNLVYLIFKLVHFLVDTSDYMIIRNSAHSYNIIQVS
jgi:hypothetical protein